LGGISQSNYDHHMLMNSYFNRMLRRAALQAQREAQKTARRFFASAADGHAAPTVARPPPKHLPPEPAGPAHHTNITSPGWYNNPATRDTVKETDLYSWLKDFPKDTPESQTSKKNGIVFYTATYGSFAASVAGGYWLRVRGLNKARSKPSLIFSPSHKGPFLFFFTG